MNRSAPWSARNLPFPARGERAPPTGGGRPAPVWDAVPLQEEEPMDSKSWLIRFAAVMLVVPVVACTSDDDTDVEIDADTEAPPPAMAPVTVTIQPMGGSTLA